MEAILIKAAGLALMIFAGYGLKRLGVFRGEDAKVLSRIIIHLTLPAALVVSFRDFYFDIGYLALIVIAVACNLGLLLLGLRITRGKDVSVRALYGLNLSSYNIGTFVLPFVQSFLPTRALIGVSMFDAGNCPFNTGLGYAVVSAQGQGRWDRLRFVTVRLARSVPFMTYLALTLLSLLQIHLPDAVYQIASTVSGANTVLAMLMIGILFEVHAERDKRRQVFHILAVRYGCNFLLAALVWFLPLPLLIRQVSVLALLAPIPSISMVYCERCGCDPSIYGVVNSLSIVVSLCLTFPLLLILNL